MASSLVTVDQLRAVFVARRGTLSDQLARLRGVFQAIATVAAVQINLSLMLYFTDVTGGPIGLNGLTRSVSAPGLVLFLVTVVINMLGKKIIDRFTND